MTRSAVHAPAADRMAPAHIARRRRHTPVVAAAGACLLVLTTAGCGGSDSGPAGDQAPLPTPGTTVSAAPDAAGEGARADLAGALCDSEGGTWSLHGTVRNPGAGPARYTVTATVAETRGGSVHGRKEMVVTVAPGAEAAVDAERFLHDTGDGLACTIGVRKTPA